MVKSKEAMSLFRKKFPELTITRAAVYDDTYYIVEALKNPNEVDYSDPYYVIDKNTGKISGFLPTDNLARFHAAFRDNSIAIDGG